MSIWFKTNGSSDTSKWLMASDYHEITLKNISIYHYKNKKRKKKETLRWKTKENGLMDSLLDRPKNIS